MLDEQMRELERRARAGDKEAEAERLRIAARTGDPGILDAIDAQLVARGEQIVASTVSEFDGAVRRAATRIARLTGARDTASLVGQGLKEARTAIRQACNVASNFWSPPAPHLCYAAQPRSARNGWVALVRIDCHKPDAYHHKEHKAWDFGPEWTRTDQLVVGLAFVRDPGRAEYSAFVAWPELAPPGRSPVVVRPGEDVGEAIKRAGRHPDKDAFGKWVHAASLDRVRADRIIVAAEWAGIQGSGLERFKRR